LNIFSSKLNKRLDHEVNLKQFFGALSVTFLSVSLIYFTGVE
jgi:hypothetical protein